MFAAGGSIAWQSKSQTTVVASTMEAEYMAAFNAIQEFVWVKGVMSEIGFLYDSHNPMHHNRSKHIDIKYYWIREKVGD